MLNSAFSILFHIGLLLTPLLLFDHVYLVKSEIGISWYFLTLPKTFADYLTLMTIIVGLIVLILRITNKTSRFISRKQDYLWPLLLVVPFTTGYICSNVTIQPDTYNFYMLIHLLSACLIFILIC